MAGEDETQSNERARGRYLSGDALAGPVLQEEAHHLQVVFLGCHVQGREAILQNREKTRAHGWFPRGTAGKAPGNKDLTGKAAALSFNGSGDCVLPPCGDSKDGDTRTRAERGRAHLRLSVDVGSIINQLFDHF